VGFKRNRSKHDGNHDEIVEALEDVGCIVVDLSAVGGGCPDILVWRRSTGMLRLLEIKNPETTAKTHRKVDRKLTETEIKQEAFRSLVPVWVVKTVDEALEAMGVKRAA
jgi:hypothetical protein